jgi:hypothetical protein
MCFRGVIGQAFITGSRRFVKSWALIADIAALRGSGMGMNAIAKKLKVGNSQVLRVCQEMAA